MGCRSSDFRAAEVLSPLAATRVGNVLLHVLVQTGVRAEVTAAHETTEGAISRGHNYFPPCQFPEACSGARDFRQAGCLWPRLGSCRTRTHLTQACQRPES